MDSQKITPQMIDVCPGFRLRLRGAEETWQAIQMGQIEVIDCSSCCTALCCIYDVSYVLCPSCRSITPLSVTTTEDNPIPPSNEEADSLGLGVRADALFWWCLIIFFMLFLRWPFLHAWHGRLGIRGDQTTKIELISGLLHVISVNLLYIVHNHSVTASHFYNSIHLL